MSGINQFTERAQRVLSYAAREAANAKAPMIGTEHLLAGLLLVEDSTAGTVLADLNITIDAVREWFPRVRKNDRRSYYQEHIQKFILDRHLIKGLFIKVPVDAPKIGRAHV